MLRRTPAISTAAALCLGAFYGAALRDHEWTPQAVTGSLVVLVGLFGLLTIRRRRDPHDRQTTAIRQTAGIRRASRKLTAEREAHAATTQELEEMRCEYNLLVQETMRDRAHRFALRPTR